MILPAPTDREYPLQIAGLRFSLRGAELELDLERCEKV